MENFLLEKIINEKLLSNQYKDIVPNGLQIEGSKHITKIITGVTASQELLDKALSLHANAIIVHHGYFWKQDSKYIQNIQRKRLKTILSNNINLYSWHFPLDIHPELGNNAQIAKKLNILIQGNISPYVPWGIFPNKLNSMEFVHLIESTFDVKPIHFNLNISKDIQRIAWCSGKGQGFFKKACIFGIDAFLTGEISEETMHIAKEFGVHFYSIGHHNSEKDGIISLSHWLQKKYNLDVKFININNPA